MEKQKLNNYGIKLDNKKPFLHYNEKTLKEFSDPKFADFNDQKQKCCRILSVLI